MLEQLGEYGSFSDDKKNPDCVLVRGKIGINDRFYLQKVNEIYFRFRRMESTKIYIKYMADVSKM